MAKEWDEGVRFFMGQQHIQYSRVGKAWEDIPVTRYNEWFPRPVTNYIAPTVMTMVSLFTRQKPSATIYPNSEDEADKSAAKLADKILDAKWELDQEQREYIRAQYIKLLTGTVFKKTNWDSSKGEPVLLMGEDGVPYESKNGDVSIEYIDPFRMKVDLNGQNFFIEENVKPVSWIKEHYDREGNGYTGLASKIQEDEDLSDSLRTQNLFKSDSFKGSYKSSEKDNLKGCCVIKEAYFAPSRKYPKGLQVIVASGQVLYIESYKGAKNTWHPYDWDKWIDIPFRFHGKSYVKDLIPLQLRINGIDALIELTLRTTGMPQWLIPNGCGVPEGYITGKPGLEIRFNQVGSSGLYPQKVSPEGVHPQMWKWREETVTAFYMEAGTNEVMQGMRPEGVNTASGLNLLLEQSYSKFSPQLSSSEKFIERTQQAKIQIIADFYKEVRPELVQFLKQLNRDNLDVEIFNFVGADLRDNTRVRVEAGSSIPKSKAFEQEMLKQLGQAGMFGPIDPVSNPIGNEEFLEKFGISPIHSEINADVKRARWINSVLTSVNRGQMSIDKVPPILPVDNLDIHFKVLTDEIKRPEFKDEQGLFQMRAQQIDSILQEEARKQQLAQQEMMQGQAEIPPQGQPPSNVPQDLQGLPVGPPFNNNLAPNGVNLGENYVG